MSLINVTNIKIGNNVCNIKLPLIFQIEFECLEHLKHDVEWKVIYITSDGSGYINNTNNSNNTTDNSINNPTHTTDSTNNSTNNTTDGSEEKEYLISNNKGEIILDAVCLGPLYKGILEFEFRVNPPNFHRLNPECILGMQAILISGNYCEQEFIRIGYYTNNVYDEESLVENPPDLPILDKIVRCIIDQPRVTRFPIKWDNDYLVDFEGNNLNFIIQTDSDNSVTVSGTTEDTTSPTTSNSNNTEVDTTSNNTEDTTSPTISNNSSSNSSSEVTTSSNSNEVDTTSHTTEDSTNSSGTSEDSSTVGPSTVTEDTGKRANSVDTNNDTITEVDPFRVGREPDTVTDDIELYENKKRKLSNL
uniref:Chromatin assembly protein, putative n=1 Tax=Theileria annulata TaxID=5874 RepID=A0A3B0MN41_THEAN